MSSTPQPKPEIFDPKHVGGVSGTLLAVGAAGILASAIGAVMNPTQFAYSWLFGFMYFFTICAGNLFWTLVHHATDAEWSVVVRRVWENVACLIPLLILFFIPILLFRKTLFKWWEIPVGMDEVLDKKRAFLNHPFFVFRAAFYLCALSFVALTMRKLSTRQDSDGSAGHTIKMRKLAFAGIPIFGISLTFGAIDWLMGLDYKWFSTMWGVYIFAGAAGSAMSLGVLLITFLRSKGYLARVVSIEHYHVMGKLMLAFTVFWAYIGFSQYMLIWYANIPEETSYFIRRNIESWNYLSLFLVVGRFFIPFPLLLLQWTKKNPKYLCMVAGWILFMQLLDMYVVVMPMLHQTGVKFNILDLCALAAIGAPLAFVFLKNLDKRSLFPVRDPRILESIKLTN